MKNSSIDAKEIERLIELLKKRFEANRIRHKNIDWKEVERKIESNDRKIILLISNGKNWW